LPFFGTKNGIFSQICEKTLFLKKNEKSISSLDFYQNFPKLEYINLTRLNRICLRRIFEILFFQGFLEPQSKKKAQNWQKWLKC